LWRRKIKDEQKIQRAPFCCTTLLCLFFHPTLAPLDLSVSLSLSFFSLSLSRALLAHVTQNNLNTRRLQSSTTHACSCMHPQSHSTTVHTQTSVLLFSPLAPVPYMCSTCIPFAARLTSPSLPTRQPLSLPAVISHPALADTRIQGGGAETRAKGNGK